MARLEIAPHVADKILNHRAGTISQNSAVHRNILANAPWVIKGHRILTGRCPLHDGGGINGAHRTTAGRSRGSGVKIVIRPS
jgi:hypothetical protein